MRPTCLTLLVFLGAATLPSAAQYALARTPRDLETQQKLNEIARDESPQAYQKALLKEAKHGSPYAELALGIELLTPPPPPPAPAHFIPVRERPADYPPLNDAEGVHWLQLASAAGAGQASEILAQAAARGNTPGLQPQDAPHFHALAVQQGYDLQILTVACYRLVHDREDLVCRHRHSLTPCLDPATLAKLTSMGARGTLTQESLGGSLPVGLLAEPFDPATAVVILDHPPEVVATFSQPLHTTGLFLQTADGWQSNIDQIPHANRAFMVTPPGPPFDSVSVRTDGIDGSHGGGSCLSFNAPQRRPRTPPTLNSVPPTPAPQAPQ